MSIFGFLNIISQNLLIPDTETDTLLTGQGDFQDFIHMFDRDKVDLVSNIFWKV